MSSSIDNNGYIKNGMRADVFRMSVENKNILSHPYSMYVGTGESVPVSVSGESYLLPKTGELTPGESGHVLLCKSSAAYGLSFEKISPDSLATNIIYNTKAAKASTADYCALAPKANVATYNASKEWVIEDKLASLEKQDGTPSDPCILINDYDLSIGFVRITQLFKESGFCVFDFAFSFYAASTGAPLKDVYLLGDDPKETCSVQLPLDEKFLPKNDVEFFLKRDKLYASSDKSIKREAVLRVCLRTTGILEVSCASSFGSSMLDSFHCDLQRTSVSVIFPGKDS